MPDVFHVGANLVCSSCFEHTFHQRHITEAFHHGVVSNGGFTNLTLRRKNRHLQTVFGMARDVALYSTTLRLTISPNEGIVATARGFLEELGT